MPRPRKSRTQTVQAPEVKDPHHLLVEEEKTDVARMEARINENGETELVANFEPFFKRHDIVDALRTRPGRYVITGLDHEGNRLKSWVELEVKATQDLGGGFKRDVGAGPLAETSEVYLMQQQLNMLAEEKKALMAERDRMERLKDTTSSSQTAMLMKFLEKERELEREAIDKAKSYKEVIDEREEARQYQLEMERRRIDEERERLHREALDNLRREHAKDLDSIKREHSREIETIRSDYERQIAYEKARYDMQLDAYKAQQEQRMEFFELTRTTEIEAEKRRLRDEYKNDLPDAVIKKIWDRKIDREFPEETSIERMLKQFGPLLMPILEAMQKGGGVAGMLPQQQQPLPTQPQQKAIVKPARPVNGMELRQLQQSSVPGEEEVNAIMAARMPFSDEEDYTDEDAYGEEYADEEVYNDEYLDVGGALPNEGISSYLSAAVPNRGVVVIKNDFSDESEEDKAASIAAVALTKKARVNSQLPQQHQSVMTESSNGAFDLDDLA